MSSAAGGRRMSGAAEIARNRRVIERKAAVQRALAQRRGGPPAGYAPAPAPAPASPSPSGVIFAPGYSLDTYEVTDHLGYPAQPAFPARPTATGSAAAVHPAERPWWEDDPTKPRRVGLPKHGKSFIAGVFDATVSLVIFAIAPALLMGTAASRYGLNLSQQIMSAALIGVAIAGFAFARWMFMRGTPRRLMLSLAQVGCVMAWILLAITPEIHLKYYDVEVFIGLLRYLVLAAAAYGLMSLVYVAEYFCYKPMLEAMRRAKIAA